MNGAFEIGAVSLRAQQQALETMSNNIANVNTPAFKRSDIVFSEVVAAGNQPRTETEALAQANLPLQGGVRMANREMVSIQGELRQTGQMLDVAIEGRGFIELMGSEGQSLFWRGGRLSINRDGYLATDDGHTLRALISVPDDASALTIDRDGIVSAATDSGEAIELGQIMLAHTDSDSAMERVDNGYYRIDSDARTVESIGGEDGSGTFEQGMIEGSNVDFSLSMVEMLMIQRAYAASAQIVSAADQIAAVANNLKR